MDKTRGPSISGTLLRSSREAALNAVQTFNNPLTAFKTETFIVLMVIAWTYLLHAYYRNKRVDYRYRDTSSSRRKFQRTKSGTYKFWSLERCLDDDSCPLDRPTSLNLRFLAGLRNEIEHHKSAGADNYFSGRYLACCLNYERYVCECFGEKHSLGRAAAFTLQFRDLRTTGKLPGTDVSLPSGVAKYLTEFDEELSDADLASPNFRRRFLFMPVATSRRAQADEVIAFIGPDSALGRQIGEQYEKVLFKEVERQKYRPGQIVRQMNSEGYVRFSMHYHTRLWKERNAKKPGKGYGVSVAGSWYWYDRWLHEVRQYCADNAEAFATGN